MFGRIARSLIIFLCVFNLTGCKNPPEVQEKTTTPVAKPAETRASTPPPIANPQTGPDVDKMVQPEIQALAEGLDYDPRLIYEYVLNYYDTVPVLGLMKNARDTYLSKRGNPFDQAVLLSDLLRASGYKTEFVFAIIQLPLTQAMTWIGAENAEVLSQVLDGGGIYHVISQDKVSLKHIWVRVNINGAWFELDPSLKEYRYSQGIDLSSALGYSRDEYTSSALQGATVTASYIKNLNSTNIDKQLTKYAGNLSQYLHANTPFASLGEVVGGRSIVSQTLKALPEKVPYTVEKTLGTFSDIPDDLQYRLHIQLPGVDYMTPLPDISGDRITITYVGATAADKDVIKAAGGIQEVYPAYKVQMVPELRIGGALMATGSAAPLGSQQEASVSVTTPYFIGDNPVVWQARPKQLQVGAVYAYPISLEGISDDALRRHNNLEGDYRAAGKEKDSEPMLGESLYLIGASYANEVETIGRLDAALAKVIFVPQMLASWTSQNLIVTETESSGGAQQAKRVAWGSYNIDVSLGSRVVRSVSGNGVDARAFNTHLEQRASAAEHAILEQLQRASAWSTVKAIDYANEQANRIYRIDSSNIDSILPTLKQPDHVKDQIRQLASRGRIVIIPEQVTQYKDFRGSGYWSYDPGSGVLDGLINGGLVAGVAANAQPAATMGGSSTEIIEISIDELLALLEMGFMISTGCNQGCDNPFQFADNNAGSDPVDTATGAFLNQTTDLAFGVLGFPIQFTRTYSSARHNSAGTLGYGWTNNYALSLSTSSEWSRSLGYRTAMDAVAAITESFIGIDIARAPQEGLSMAQILTGTAGATWATNQVIHNAVAVSGFNGEHHQFLRMPDGSFQPGHHDYTTLDRNPDQTYTLSDKTGKKTEFDDRGRCLALVDANGNRTVFKYDAEGMLSAVTDPSGRFIQLSYTDRRIVEIIDPAGNQYRYVYDPAGNLASYRDPLGNATQYLYDQQHRLTLLTDAGGNQVTDNTYDAWDRVTRQVDGRGGVLAIRYGDARSVAVGPMESPTINYYDSYQRLVGQEDALQNLNTILYDANDNRLQVSDRSGHINIYAYDSRGNVTRVTDPLGNSTVNEYDDQNHLVRTIDRTNAETTFAYDAKRNLINAVNPMGGMTSYTYDSRGLPLTITDASGQTKTLEYDNDGNLIRSTDALGHVETRTYDEMGHCLSYTDAAGQTSTFTYDAMGHTLQRTDPLGRTTSYAYDANGLLISVTDARGNTTRNAYDGQYTLIQVTDALGNPAYFERDLNGNLVAQTDANGNTTRYERDPLGRTISITDPLGRQVQYGYDADGNMKSKTKADGRVIYYQYDDLSRLNQVTYPDGSLEVWEYDAEGRVTGSSYEDWQAQYSLDALGRVATADLAGEGIRMAFDYDPTGNRTGIKVLRGGDTLYDARYEYDAADRLTSANDALSGYSVGYDYFDNDLPSAVVHSSSARVQFTRDAAGQITGLAYLDANDRLLVTIRYEYDAAGNLIRQEQEGMGNQVISYEYDELDRLVNEDRAGSQTEYTYDAGGNRIKKITPQETLVYTYNDADELLGGGETSFSYDENGNQVSRTDETGTYTLEYDDRNQLAKVVSPSGQSSEFLYDTAGIQIAIRDDDGIHKTVRDGYLALLTGTENFEKGQSFLWAAGQLAYGTSLDAGEAVRTAGYFSDGLGNVDYIVDADGSLTAVDPFDPYGNPLVRSKGGENSYLFQGMLGVEVEPALDGIYLMGHRYYDSATGRFLTRDLLSGQPAQPQTLNRYIYALSNPLRYQDPQGLNPSQEQIEEMQRWWREFFASSAWQEMQARLSGTFAETADTTRGGQSGTNENSYSWTMTYLSAGGFTDNPVLATRFSTLYAAQNSNLNFQIEQQSGTQERWELLQNLINDRFQTNTENTANFVETNNTVNTNMQDLLTNP